MRKPIAPREPKARRDSYYRRVGACMALVMLLGLFGLSVASFKAYGSLNCRTVFRNRFYLLTVPLQAIKDALNANIKLKLANRKRGERVLSFENARVAQSEKVLAKIRDFDVRVKEYAAKNKVDEVTANEAVGKELEAEMVAAMKSKATYPTIEEMLAVMAFRSPTFRNEIFLFLENHTSVRWQYRWKIAAHFAESVSTGRQRISKWWANHKLDEYFTLLQDPDLPSDVRAKYEEKLEYYFEQAHNKEAEVGLGITYGRRFFELWQTRMRLPTRKMWTSEDFHSMMMEFSDVLFSVNHPESFRKTWIGAFASSPWDASGWEVMRRFADNVMGDYRARYKSYLEGAAYDTYGKPRPEVLAEFYQFGFADTVTRRLVAVVRERHKIWSEIQAQPTKWGKLKTGLAKALDEDIVFQKEVEQLTLETMYVMKPLIEGLFLYLATDYVYTEVSERKRGRDYMKHLQEHPEELIPQNNKTTNTMLRGMEDEIYQKTITLRKIEKELKDAKLTDEERSKLLANKAALEKRIAIVTKIKQAKLESMSRLAPRKE